MKPRKKQGKRAATVRRNRVRVKVITNVTPKPPSGRFRDEYYDEWPPGYDSDIYSDF